MNFICMNQSSPTQFFVLKIKSAMTHTLLCAIATFLLAFNYTWMIAHNIKNVNTLNVLFLIL